MKFVEVGWGLPSFVSSEVEYEDGSEERFPGVVRLRPRGIYLRAQVRRMVLIVDVPQGVKVKRKPYGAVKFVFGVRGE